MRIKTSSPLTITVTEAERDLRKVLRAVERSGFVRLTKGGRVLYHIGKEESGTKLLARLKASAREHAEGRTKMLQSLADL